MTGVKICGLTRRADAELAARLGATALGVVFAPSPRRVTAHDARRILGGIDAVARVGVFVDATLDAMIEAVDVARLDVVQLAGAESVALATALRDATGVRILRAVPMDRPLRANLAAYPADAFLLDASTGGGSGRAWDWRRARALHLPPAPIVLAGGLSPRNVADAIRALHPAAVDVCTGVERAPGLKDESLLAAFIDAARAALRPEVAA